MVFKTMMRENYRRLRQSEVGERREGETGGELEEKKNERVKGGRMQRGMRRRER